MGMCAPWLGVCLAGRSVIALSFGTMRVRLRSAVTLSIQCAPRGKRSAYGAGMGHFVWLGLPKWGIATCSEAGPADLDDYCAHSVQVAAADPDSLLVFSG